MRKLLRDVAKEEHGGEGHGHCDAAKNHPYMHCPGVME